MNEVCAALGLLQLRDIESVISRRRELDAAYRNRLHSVIGIEPLATMLATKSNYAYFPILVKRDYPLSRDALYERLRQSQIYARRYFYPLITEFPMYRGLPSARRESLAVAHDVAERIICLPIFPDLTEIQLSRVTEIIRHP